jgi:hypothetical protein
MIERFFDHLGAAACLAGLRGRDVLTQPSHRLVGMIERQRIGPRDMYAVLPRAGMAIGAGYHQSMQHSEVDRALGIEAEATVSQMTAQHVTATDLDPEPAEHQIRTDTAPTQFRQPAAIETGQHDRSAGVTRGGGDQSVE